MVAGGTVRQCVRQERTQHRGAGRQISSAWCLGEVEERNKVRFLFAMEILPGNPAFVKFEGHAPGVPLLARAEFGEALADPRGNARSARGRQRKGQLVIESKSPWMATLRAGERLWRRCVRAAHWARLRRSCQLVFSRRVAQGMGAGRVATSRIMTS